MPSTDTDPAGLRRQINLTTRRAATLRRLADSTTGQLHAWLTDGADLEHHLAGVLQRHLAWLESRTQAAREILREEPPQRKPARPKPGERQQPFPLDTWLREPLQ